MNEPSEELSPSPPTVKKPRRKRSDAEKAQAREYTRLYRLRFPEKVKAATTAWRKANPDKVKAMCDRKRVRDADKIRIAKKKHYAENREKMLEEMRARYYLDLNKSRGQRRLHYQKNRKKAIAKQREWVLKNKDRVKETKRRWAENNKEKRKLSVSKWVKANPEKNAAIATNNRSKRRAAAKKAKRPATTAQIQTLLSKSKTCAYCEVRYSTTNKPTLDHVTPIHLGGSHSLDNLTTCCLSCNSKKGSKAPEIFASELGRLLI